MGYRAVSALRRAAVAGLLLVATGCEAYRIGNPFLPRAKLLASADDQVVLVELQLQKGGQIKTTVDPPSVNFTLRPFPNDITPGVRISAYKLEWFDSTGARIEDRIIPTRIQGITVYLEKGAGAGASAGTTEGKVQVGVDSDAVIDFGLDNAFDASGIRQSNWSQYLTGKVTFSGRDDHGYAIDDVSATFTLFFKPSVSDDFFKDTGSSGGSDSGGGGGGSSGSGGAQP